MVYFNLFLLLIKINFRLKTFLDGFSCPKMSHKDFIIRIYIRFSFFF